MDLNLGHLIIEKDRPAHIAKHGVTVKEVYEIIFADYVFIKGREDRWLLIGRTKRKRYLTIVVGKRSRKNTYGLVTARPASREERSFYKEFTFQIGGEQNGENKTN